MHIHILYERKIQNAKKTTELLLMNLKSNILIFYKNIKHLI